MQLEEAKTMFANCIDRCMNGDLGGDVEISPHNKNCYILTINDTDGIELSHSVKRGIFDNRADVELEMYRLNQRRENFKRWC